MGGYSWRRAVYDQRPHGCATTFRPGFGLWFPASGQSVVSTHSGVVYFFVGSAFLADEPLEQKFGRFP